MSGKLAETINNFVSANFPSLNIFIWGRIFMHLIKYAIRRLLLLFPVLMGVLIIAFFLTRILPGDPLHLMLGPESDEILVERVRQEMGLDKPLPTQFWIYLTGLLKGDWGTAWHTGNPVLEDIKNKFPVTFELVTLGLILCIMIAIPIGVLTAIRRDGFADHFFRGFALIGSSIPSFWLALLLIYFFYYQLDWFPPPMGRVPIGFTVQRVTGMNLVDTLLEGNWVGFLACLKHITLPVITLSLINMAPIIRLTRSAMIEVLNSDYILAARAAGLPRSLVIFRLALKNALLAPITMIGIIYGLLLSGTVITETIFAWPGIGLWSLDAAKASDYAPLQGFAILAAFTRVLIFFITDLVCFWIDPKIRY